MTHVNGHGPTEAPAARSALLPEGLEWQPSYDRESLERFAAAVAEERARLQAELDAARQRLEAARTASSALDLTVLIEEAQRELDGIEREQHEIIGVIKATAEREAHRLVAEATRHAEALRAVHRHHPVEREA